MASAVPEVVTASASVTSQSVIINATATCTLTLPSAPANSGNWFYMKSIAPQVVQSAAANVVPLGGGAPGSAIFGAYAPLWSIFQSDGTNWVTFATNALS